MSERRENSVLVALRELRGIEDDRVKREQEDARARIEADRAAKEAADRRMREDEENRRLAEEDRLRRIEEEKVSKIREEQLRLEDADRRARVDGEMKLQEQRMRLEIQSRAGKSPLKVIVGVAVVLALVGGVVVYKIQAAHREEFAASQKKAAEEKAAELAAARAESDKKILAITREMESKLKLAHSEAEREKIITEARVRSDAARAASDDRPGKAHGRKIGGSGTGAEQPKAPGVHVPGKRDINDNILDGL